MDGRVQLPVIEYLKRRLGAEYVDMITETGPVDILADDSPSPEADAILRRISVSMNGHGSRRLAIVAHHDCLGNPIPDEQQKDQVIKCMEMFTRKYPEVKVVGLWVNADWKVEEIRMY